MMDYEYQSEFRFGYATVSLSLKDGNNSHDKLTRHTWKCMTCRCLRLTHRLPDAASYSRLFRHSISDDTDIHGRTNQSRKTAENPMKYFKSQDRNDNKQR